MLINKYAYFATGDGADASGDAAMLPIENFTGISLVDDDHINLLFVDCGDSHATTTSHVTITHDTGASQEAMEQVAAALCSNPGDGFIVVADKDNEVFGSAGINVITDAGITV
tara:strand:+ start:391 stop:729 length:339 start_codon:yes stop_codon:yes gene_type:complete